MGSESEKIFEEVSSFVRFPDKEIEVLQFWKENDIFGKLRSQNAGKPKFVFLEGPPTANGIPHIGHSAGRAIKDTFLRFNAMNGKDVVPWKGGWDCHGLPVEIGVEKELGLRSKKDVVEFGMAEFNRLCRKSVMRYEEKWKDMSERLGFWIDMENPYVTMTDDYIESVWWSLSQFYEKGLLEKGHYIVPYCPRCGTPLSSHEVAQGYKEVKELSVTLKFKLAKDYHSLGENAFILAWTTTPWTLPGNVALAVGKDIDYAIVKQNTETLILANELVEKVIEGEYELLGTIKGEQMLGWKYEPLFDFMDLSEHGQHAYEVVMGDFVTTEEGTGVVHTAVMYGEDDYNLGMKLGLPAIHTVGMDGKFNDTVKPWAGQFVKKQGLDVEIAIHLHEHNRLYTKGNYVHTYPFCWRCDSPLLYYALDSWFIRMSRLRDEMMANNEEITWQPDHLKHGRFGNFLEELKDWALSRNRFWGTPLPIWTCDCGKEICVGSFEELKELVGGTLPVDFEPHRPWVDDLPVKCPDCRGRMTREEYVIDTWYDSGSAPFAQFHYPFENQEKFREMFPADFITEAIDQTRGWFYTLLAVNTGVFGETPYKNCLCQGLLLNSEGQKMSKSKGTAIDAYETFDKSGADATRLALMYGPCWTSQKFNDQGLREAHSKVMNTLWNCYSFFVSNANMDGFIPEELDVPGNELDRWIISRLNSTNAEIRKGIGKMEVHKSVRAIFAFIDDLSNWYLRRSRRRFWADNVDEDKRAAYGVLYHVLKDTARMLAPFTPYMSEQIYRNLKYGDSEPISVHLTSYPEVNEGLIDTALEEEMALVIKAAEVGRNARQTSGLKLRQPLSKAYIVLDEGTIMKDSMKPLLLEELNVKEIEFTTGDATFGDRCRSAEGPCFTVYVDMTITPELASEGLARDIVRRIQSLRKDEDLRYDQHIELGYDGDDEMLRVLNEHADYIQKETLADTLQRGEISNSAMKEWNIDGKKLVIWLGKE